MSTLFLRVLTCWLFAAPDAFRIQLHSGHRFAVTMLPHPRLPEASNTFAILRHFTLDWALTADFLSHLVDKEGELF